MVNQLKIGISGKARTGKDTVANMLREILCSEPDMQRTYALAYPIKQVIKLMFPFVNDECLYGPSEKREDFIDRDKYGNITYRDVLLDIGKLGRKYSPDTWLYLLDMDLLSHKEKKLYICSDVRFINEFQFLKRRGFHMIRVLRDDYSRFDDISEIEQDSIPNNAFDYLIDNNKDISDLQDMVNSIVNKLTF